MDIQDCEFTLHNPGAWVTLVEDAKASDRRAARMPASHNQWATQYPVPGDLGSLGKWHCYASLRCETKAQAGAACAVGLYNGPEKKGETTIVVQIPDVADGEYHTIDLGLHELKPGMYFWIAPTGKPNDVTAIYTDRIFLIRCTETSPPITSKPTASQQIRMDSNGTDSAFGIHSGNPGDLHRDRAASGSRGARDRLVGPPRRS